MTLREFMQTREPGAAFAFADNPKSVYVKTFFQRIRTPGGADTSIPAEAYEREVIVVGRGTAAEGAGGGAK